MRVTFFAEPAMYTPLLPEKPNFGPLRDRGTREHGER
jgi:hypothetical protein